MKLPNSVPETGCITGMQPHQQITYRRERRKIVQHRGPIGLADKRVKHVHCTQCGGMVENGTRRRHKVSPKFHPSTLRITTKENQHEDHNVPRDVLYWHDLTDAERKEFDYLDTEDRQNDASFVRYKGWCYDMGEFACVPNIDGTANDYNSFQGWDGYHSDSFSVALFCVGFGCQSRRTQGPW